MQTIDEKTRKQVEREYLARILQSTVGPTSRGLSVEYAKRLRKRDVVFTIFILSGILSLLYYVIIQGKEVC